MYGVCGRLNDLKIDFIATLSMPNDEPSIPEPTKGFPVNLNNPWITPSSPFGPCKAGNHTSTLLLSIMKLVKLLIDSFFDCKVFFDSFSSNKIDFEYSVSSQKPFFFYINWIYNEAFFIIRMR